MSQLSLSNTPSMVGNCDLLRFVGQKWIYTFLNWIEFKLKDKHTSAETQTVTKSLTKERKLVNISFLKMFIILWMKFKNFTSRLW